MRFTHEGTEYRIGFQYNNVKTGRNKVRNYCTARIETGTDRNNVNIVAQARVVRFVNDKFVKETARQYALKAMLKNAVTNGFNNEFYKAAINAYKNRSVVVATPATVSAGAASYVTPQYQADLKEMERRGL